MIVFCTLNYLKDHALTQFVISFFGVFDPFYPPKALYS